MKQFEPISRLNEYSRKLKYHPTPAGLVRILFWTIFFLWLSTEFLPPVKITGISRKHVKSTLVVPMRLNNNDPRWLRDDFLAFPETGVTEVAWITGSSIVIRNQGKTRLLPELVGQNARNSHGLEMKTYMYSQNARRLLDTYTMVKDALLRKPDAMVIIINPFWEYNGKAIFFRPSVFNHGAQLWWNKYDWPMQFMLTSPANHLYSTIGRQIPLVAARLDYARLLRKEVGWTAGIAQVDRGLKKHIRHQPRNKKRLSQSLQFWIMHGDLAPHIGKLDDGGQLDARAWQSTAISLADTHPDSWQDTLLHQLFESVRNSGIPTLVYLAPVSLAMNETYAVSAYNSVSNAFHLLKLEYEGETLKFIERFPKRIKETLVFRDYLHLSSPGALPAYLSDQLLELITSK